MISGSDVGKRCFPRVRFLTKDHKGDLLSPRGASARVAIAMTDTHVVFVKQIDQRGIDVEVHLSHELKIDCVSSAPWIDEIDTEALEILDVARRQSEIMCNRSGCDQAINR